MSAWDRRTSKEPVLSVDFGDLSPVVKGTKVGNQHYSLIGATLVTPTEVLPDAVLTVSNGCIVSLGQPPSGYVLQLRDRLVFPGLINAHDHLNGTWWPRVGPGRPYANVYQWLADLDSSPVRYDRQQNSVDDIYELGVYRNLISGVTTVADHFWRIDRPEFYTRFPIDVLYEYGRTWTPREPTAWGDDIPTEYELALRTLQPYIIHLAEGVDQETAAEMDVLLQSNALGRNTLIVHGISLRPDDMRAIATAGASVCWCPASNLYLYEQTADIPALLEAGVNIALGTDSSLTGGLNLLDELQTAQRTLQLSSNKLKGGRPGQALCDDRTGQPLSAQWLVEAVTTRAAYALLRGDRRGRIAPGYEADLLVLPDGGQDPYTTLIETRMSDIALLCRAGIPIYGDPIYRPLFEQFNPHFTSVFISEKTLQGEQPAAKVKLIAGDPLRLLDRLSRTVGRVVKFPFLPLTAPQQKKARL